MKCDMSVCPSGDECLRLKTPVNGNKSSEGLTIGTVVYFWCNDGYHMEGAPVLECNQTLQWNGTEPVCSGKRRSRA